MRKYVRPEASRVNIHKRIGWHTFRHTYSTLLRSVGAEFKGKRTKIPSDERCNEEPTTGSYLMGWS
jgi:hypothetical protein